MLISTQSNNPKEYGRVIMRLDIPWKCPYVKYYVSSINTKANILMTTDDDYLLFQSADGIRVGDFISDLKRTAAQIVNPSIFIVKIANKLTIIKENDFKRSLKDILLGSRMEGKKQFTITGFDVYSFAGNANFIKFATMKFFSYDPSIFSFFKGFPYRMLDEFDMELINPFIVHVFKIICNSNAAFYNYVMKWIAYVIQNLTGKTGTAIVLTGAHGAGKNTFTDQICKLLGDYANENTKSDSIFGTFNGALFNKKLLVCNEMQSFENSKKLNYDLLKTLITENTMDINLKHKDEIHVENICNFIFLSNHFAPIKIEKGDRRFVVIRVSPMVRNSKQYFEPLYATFTPEFYKHLFTFFLQMDITGWDPREIPASEEKEVIQEISKSIYELFIQEFINKFIEGFEKQAAKQAFKEWCSGNGHPPGYNHEFLMEMLKYCDVKRPGTKDGTTRKYFYKLRLDSYSFFEIPQ